MAGVHGRGRAIRAGFVATSARVDQAGTVRPSDAAGGTRFARILGADSRGIFGRVLWLGRAAVARQQSEIESVYGGWSVSNESTLDVRSDWNASTAGDGSARRHEAGKTCEAEWFSFRRGAEREVSAHSVAGRNRERHQGHDEEYVRGIRLQHCKDAAGRGGDFCD